MKLKTIIAAVLMSVIVCTAASAQAPAFREQGYKGSAGLAVVGFYPGIETSHGYMINTHHYIGGGVFLTYIPGLSPIFKEFIDYQWFINDKASTPMLGAHLGEMQFINGDINKLVSVFYVEPRFGWSWALKETLGLTASAGAMIGPALGVFPAVHVQLEF